MLTPNDIWCIDSPGWGGAEKDLVRVLKMLSVSPEAVVCGEKVSTELEQFFERESIPVIRRRAGNTWRTGVKGLFDAIRLIRRFPGRRFIVWAHHSDSSRWLQLALVVLRRRPILIERALTPSEGSLSKSRLTRPIKRLVVRSAAAIVLCGHQQKAAFEHVFRVRSPNIFVIPNTRDTHHVAQKTTRLRGDLPAVRSELALEPLPTVLSIARLDRNKRQDVLIRAIAIVNEHLAAMLVLVGEGPEEGELRRLADSVAPGRVVFAGFQPDPIPWLAAADVFALVSEGEGLSGALIEAMAAHVPCVVSKIPGNEELVRSGTTGLAVSVGNPEATATALKAFLLDRDLVNRCTAAAFAMISSEYDEQRELSLWKQLLL